MKKYDLFTAGAISGLLSALFLDFLIIVLKLFGAKARAPWEDTAALMFVKPQYSTIPARLIAFPVSLITPMILGIILSLIYRRFGKDFLYFKSIFLAENGTFFMLVVVYPLLGFNLLKESIGTYFAAFFGMFLFGFLLGYFVKRFVNIDGD